MQKTAKQETFVLTNFTIAAIYQFISKFIELIKEKGVADLKMETPFNDLLLPAFQNLSIVYKHEQKSKFSDDIRVLDRKRDQTVSYFRTLVKALAGDTITIEGKAAKKVADVINKYKNILKKSFNEQSADIINMLEEINGGLLEEIKLLKLEIFVNEIAKLTKDIDDLVNLRVKEKVIKNKLDSADVKKEINVAYRSVMKLVDVYSLSNETLYSDFVENVNVLIKEFVTAKNKSARKKKISEEESAETAE